MQRKDFSRRDFVKTTTAAGVGFWVAGASAAETKPKSPNDRIQFACIGVGGKGDSDSSAVAGHGDIVAMTDVDDNTLNKRAARSQFQAAAKY